MSLIDMYAGAKYGPMNPAAFNAAAGAATKWKINVPSELKLGLFILRGTQPVRIRQGGVGITAATATNATYLGPGVHYPMLVEGPEDCYISILGGTTVAGNLEISIGNNVQSWTLDGPL